MPLTKSITVIPEADMEWYNYSDYSNFSTCEEEEAGLQGFYTIIQPVLYTIIFLLGLTGNGLMIAVLLRCRCRLRITEIYLLHLALADLMLIFTIPFSLVNSVSGWVFGDFLCMLNGVLRNLNLLCGSFLLACIGFDRYLAIVHAIPSLQSRQPRTVHLTCTSLWLFCLLLSLPNAVFLSVDNYTNNSMADCNYYRYGVQAHNWVVANRVLHHICFFSSMAVMCYCYTMLVITLYNSQKSQAKKGAVRLALLVTLVFCICWLPYNITSLMTSLWDLEVVLHDCESLIHLELVHAVMESLGISHCCLNPFLYAFAGVRFRRELVHLLCQLGFGRICGPHLRAQDQRCSHVSATSSNSTVVF